MAKQQVHIRASDRTAEQIEQLADWWQTTKTEIMSIAIDRLHRVEEAKFGHQLIVPDYASSTDTWTTTCSCGAKWRCEYTNSGLRWTPLNEQCESCPHNS